MAGSILRLKCFNEMAASREEENAEEDIFGYVCMLKENRKAAHNLYALWSRDAAS